MNLFESQIKMTNQQFQQWKQLWLTAILKIQHEHQINNSAYFREIFIQKFDPELWPDAWKRMTTIPTLLDIHSAHPLEIFFWKENLSYEKYLHHQNAKTLINAKWKEICQKKK